MSVEVVVIEYRLENMASIQDPPCCPLLYTLTPQSMKSKPPLALVRAETNSKTVTH